MDNYKPSDKQVEYINKSYPTLVQDQVDRIVKIQGACKDLAMMITSNIKTGSHLDEALSCLRDVFEEVNIAIKKE